MPLSKIQFGNTGRRNIIINGGMQVAQRNSTSAVTSVNGNYHTVDRVKATFVTSGTAQTQQVTDVPAGEGFSHSMKTTVTGADTSIAGGDFFDLYQQRIEARSISTLMYGTSGAKRTSLSFYVKSNVTGVYNGTITNQNDTVKLPFSFSISSANTWERIIIDNIPPITTGSDSGTAWETSTYLNLGATVRIYGVLGSNYYGATNKVWNTAGTATSYGHQAQVNFLSSTSNNFFITGVQWEEGSAATEFEHRTYAEELADCQRYFIRVPDSNASSAYAFLATGMATDTTTVDIPFPFPVTMRANPTLATSGSIRVYNGGTVNPSSGITLYSGSTYAGVVRVTTGSVLSTKDAILVGLNNDVDANFQFSAEY